MKLCFIGNSHLDQFKIEYLNTNDQIDRLYSVGASLKGLYNPNSKLQLNEQIQQYSFENPEAILVFFLGQVDIEFGYYYKCVCDKIKYKVEDYINELVENFEKYLLTSIKNRFVILSINPTVIQNIEHNFNVSFTNNNGYNGFYSHKQDDILFDDHKHTIYNDSYQVRFYNNKLMNHYLKTMCIKNNLLYVDFWNIIMENECEVKAKYLYDHNDHHLRITDDNEMIEYILNQIKLLLA
jgi:hypothetical protein